jgi:hypothetical protein
MSHAIVLRTEAGQDLGFVLMSGGPDAGECLITPVPILLCPELKHLDVLKRLGECQWRIVEDATVITGPGGEVVGELRDGSFRTGIYKLVAIQAGDAK